MTDEANLEQAVNLVRDRLKGPVPKIGVVAGSGLGGFVRLLEVETEIPYGEIPGFPVSTVVGHKGSLLHAKSGDQKIVVFSGRSHLYEGHDAAKAVFFVRLFAALGGKILLLSNAAGGLSAKLWPGDLMLITDHINWMFRNPLIGPNDPEVGPRFPDMSEPYDKELREMAQEVAREEGIGLRQGVYLAGHGPTYETGAEVRALQFMGADAVGMSTVIETVAAKHAGLRVLGISLISNSHVNKTAPTTTHEEVMETARLVEDKFARLIQGIVARALPAKV